MDILSRPLRTLPDGALHIITLIRRRVVVHLATVVQPFLSAFQISLLADLPAKPAMETEFSSIPEACGNSTYSCPVYLWHVTAHHCCVIAVCHLEGLFSPTKVLHGRNNATQAWWFYCIVSVGFSCSVVFCIKMTFLKGTVISSWHSHKGSYST